MSIPLNSFRKFSINVSLSEAIGQVNQQLRHLLDNTEVHFSKRKKILIQLERKNNQYRRAIGLSDSDNQKILKNNTDLIRQIKKKIIDEDRQHRQQMTDEQEQMANNSWSLGGMAALVGAALAGIISAATFIIIMLNSFKEKYV
jgi:hypothetical protein